MSKILMLICKFRSWVINRMIEEGDSKIIVCKPFIKITVTKKKRAKFILSGTLRITSSLDSNESISIYLCPGSTFELGGEFEIGNGVRIWLDGFFSLFIGGRKNSSSSGITSNALLLVKKSIHSGSFFIGAWNTFITDCDWDNYNNQSPQSDVVIGDNVWMAHHASILKGNIIHDGCVTESHSLVVSGNFLINSLIAGNTARVKLSNIYWDCDMKG